MARLVKSRVAPVVVAIAALTLSGCAAGQISQTADQVAAIDGANGSSGGVAVRDVRLAATDDNSYPAGADVPLKLWVSNAALTADSLTGITSPAATKVTIDGDTDLAAQTLLEINDSSDTTVTVNGLKSDVPYGHSIPMTFTFASGGIVTVNVPIEIPPDRGSETRETVNVLPEEDGNIWFPHASGESPG